MMYQSIWVVIRALPHDHSIQLMNHGQQQMELVAIVAQVDENEVTQQQLTNLQCHRNTSHNCIRRHTVFKLNRPKSGLTLASQLCHSKQPSTSGLLTLLY